MEVDNYVLSLQRVITSSYRSFDPEKDLDVLNKIAASIQKNCPFLESKNSLLGHHEISRKIHIVLFLHTEFETSKYYIDHDDLACIIGIIPKLNPVFYLLLVDKLKLNEYLKEVLFYSSEVISNNVLDLVSKNMKYYELDETLQLYEDIIKIIYLKLKYLELEYNEKQPNLGELMEHMWISKTQKNSDSQNVDKKCTIKAKYMQFLQNLKTFGFEFCNSLLDSSKVKNFGKDEAVIFEGYLVLSHLQLLIFCTNVECFQNNGENPEANSKQCILMTQDVIEFYQLFNDSKDFDYAKEWTELSVNAEVDLFQDCYGDLLYDLMKVLTPINTEKWIMFHEHEHGDGKTLQAEIGEHAFYLNELLKKATQKGYDHTNMKQITDTYLQHLCIKPVTEDDLIMKSLPEQLISAFQENSDVIKTRSRWLDSALRFFNSHHDEIMTIFESNLSHVNCATVFCLHDMIMDRLANEDLDQSDQDTRRLKKLLLNSLDHLNVGDQIKVVTTFVEKYAEELCIVFDSKEGSGGENEWLNVIDNQSSLQEVCSASLKHILKAPVSTLTKLMNIGLKCKPSQNCMVPVIQTLVEHILPHFGSMDLRQSADKYLDGEENSNHNYFLLDYFLNVLVQVKHSLEKGEISFLLSEEVREGGVSGNEECSENQLGDQTQLKNVTLDLNSVTKLSQQDISNLRPMIALLLQKQVLSPSDMFERCLWPHFNLPVAEIQYEYLSFVTDILMIYFENNDLDWSPTNETVETLYSVVKLYVNVCTCSMSDFTKEKYFAREQLILLLTLILEKYKDKLDLSESSSSPHPDWLKLFLNDSSVADIYQLSEDSIVPFLCQFLSRASQLEWTTLAARLATQDCLLLINAMRVLVHLVESRTNNPQTMEPYVNCLHQTMICFSSVLKDIFLPALLKFAKTLPSEFKLRLFESLSFLLARFKSPDLEQVKMFAIMSLEDVLGRIVDKVFCEKELQEHEKYLCVLIIRIGFVQTRVKLVQSIQSCRR